MAATLTLGDQPEKKDQQTKQMYITRGMMKHTPDILGESPPEGSEPLAVAAPVGVELHQPQALRVVQGTGGHMEYVSSEHFT